MTEIKLNFNFNTLIEITELQNLLLVLGLLETGLVKTRRVSPVDDRPFTYKLHHTLPPLELNLRQKIMQSVELPKKKKKKSINNNKL